MTVHKQSTSVSSPRSGVLFSVLYLWLPLVVWMGAIFFLSAQPDLPHASTGWLDLLFSSGAHLFLFAVLAILWGRALGQGWRSRLIALALTLIYALSDEFHQAFVPGRHADPWDLAFDALGAVLGLLGWVWLQRRISISPKSPS